MFVIREYCNIFIYFFKKDYLHCACSVCVGTHACAWTRLEGESDALVFELQAFVEDPG